jgi:hypothetical protein
LRSVSSVQKQECVMDFVSPMRSSGPTIVLGLLMLLAAGAPSQAAAEGPFEGFAGAWSGEGSIGMSNGGTERLRCHSNYAVGGAGDTLNMDMHCKSDTYVFELQANVTSDGGHIVGSWNEVTRGIQGGVEGQAGKGRIQATVRGQGFTAAVAVTTRGPRQSVTIRSEGQQFQDVTVTLHRGG